MFKTISHEDALPGPAGYGDLGYVEIELLKDVKIQFQKIKLDIISFSDIH